MSYYPDKKKPGFRSLRSRTLIFDDKDAIQLLKAAVARAGSQWAFAKSHGINRTHLSQMLSGKKPLSKSVMKCIDLQQVYVLNQDRGG